MKEIALILALVAVVLVSGCIEINLNTPGSGWSILPSAELRYTYDTQVSNFACMDSTGDSWTCTMRIRDPSLNYNAYRGKVDFRGFSQGNVPANLKEAIADKKITRIQQLEPINRDAPFSYVDPNDLNIDLRMPRTEGTDLVMETFIFTIHADTVIPPPEQPPEEPPVTPLPTEKNIIQQIIEAIANLIANIINTITGVFQ